MTRLLGNTDAQDGPAWTPATLGSTALALWLDADAAASFTLSGSNVSQWNDLSGNGRHATQSTDANRPTRQTAVLNGKACVRFDGSNDWLATTHSFHGYTSFAIYAVMKADTAGGSQSLVRHHQVASGAYMVFPWTNQGASAPQVILSWDGGTTSTNTTGTLTSACVLGFVRISGSSNKARRNGTEESTRSANTTSAGTLSSTTTRIGNYASSGGTADEPFDGDAHEILIVAGSLSDADRDRIEGYLAHKWGLAGSLPSGHPYKTFRP